MRVMAKRGQTPVNFHPAWVGSIAASQRSDRQGAAPRAESITAGVANEYDSSAALYWAIQNQARIINSSFTTKNGEKTDDMQYIDHLYDYYARNYHLFITAAAGNHNQGNHIGSPAKAYNVLAVGGTTDNSTSLWTDDAMWNEGFNRKISAWRNPKRSDGQYGDREKPELVASAKDILALDENNNLLQGSGTSGAAPQVAGLSALLVDRNADLEREAVALKAIILASAVHNIEGPSVAPFDGQDLKDGVGAIDATVADQIAQYGFTDTIWTYPYPYPYPHEKTCDIPCWWTEDISNSNFGIGTEQEYKFVASEGERIRIALTWLSAPDVVNEHLEDPLRTNLDLYVTAPDNTSPAGSGSTSYDNNYEVVDFLATVTGEYTIQVHKVSATESTNRLGLAWTKLATHFPDVRSNPNGWLSEVIVRSDDKAPWDLELVYFKAACDTPPSCGRGGYSYPSFSANRSFPFLSNIGAHTAILNGVERSSAIVETVSNDNDKVAMAYSGVTSPAMWTYLPAVYRHDNIKSLITVKNTGTGAFTALHYYNEQGALSGTIFRYLNAGALETFDTADCADAPSAVCNSGGAGWGGSVLMFSFEPVAVAVSTEWHSGGQRIRAGQYTGVTEGRTQLYAPSYFRFA